MTDISSENPELFKSGKAEKREDNSQAGRQAIFSDTQIMRGKVWESIAHAPIPLVHNKFLRVNTALESWKSEQLYGTSYATWKNPIQGFVYPAFEKAFASSHGHMALGTAAWLYSEYADKVIGAGNIHSGFFCQSISADRVWYVSRNM